MPKLKLDLRKELRAIAGAVQEDNARRLLEGSSLGGGSLAARKTQPHAVASKRRIRVLGERRAIAELAGNVGVASGDMLKDLTRRGNVKVGRVSFKIVPSASVLVRTRVFQSGDKRQTARPFSGMTKARIEAAAQTIAESSRNQLVATLQAKGV